METYKDVLIEGEGIKQLIPHRDPFIMVDKLHYNDSVKTVSSFTVRTDNIFFKEGRLLEPALIENIAQTAALRMGYAGLEELQNNPGATPPLGFIGAISDLKVYTLPEKDAQIITEIIFEKDEGVKEKLRNKINSFNIN